jgi:hypothetical protein
VPAVAEDAITVVLADDHQVVRSGLKMLLEAQDDLEVVAEAGDVDATRRRLAEHERLGSRGTPASRACEASAQGSFDSTRSAAQRTTASANDTARSYSSRPTGSAMPG